MKEEILTQIEADEITDRLGLAILTSVERLEPIQGKDRIELVYMTGIGYTAVAEKIYKVGDLVVFIKFDSVVPQNDLFDFMKDFKYRVKPKSFTIRNEDDIVINKIYSQGIVLPFYKCVDYFVDKTQREYQTEDDLTLQLEITKYVPKEISGGNSSGGVMKSKGSFPTHIISKTDELNLASKKKLLELFKGKKVVARLKMEGMSFTALNDPGSNELFVCSRNNNLSECEGSKFWQVANKNNLKDVLKNNNLCLQAEIMGPGIQKNKLQLEDPDIYAFTLTDITTRKRLDDSVLNNFCISNNINLAPFLQEWENFDLTFEQLQEIADQLEYLPGVPAEGLVLRVDPPEWNERMQDWLSVKIINRNYSL